MLVSVLTTLIFSGLLMATPAYAGELFAIPEGTFNEFAEVIGTLFTDLAPIIWLAIGISMAFYVIRKMVSLIGHLRA